MLICSRNYLMTAMDEIECTNSTLYLDKDAHPLIHDEYTWQIEEIKFKQQHIRMDCWVRARKTTTKCFAALLLLFYSFKCKPSPLYSDITNRNADLRTLKIR